MPASSSGENSVGPPSAPTRTSLTRLRAQRRPQRRRNLVADPRCCSPTVREARERRLTRVGRVRRRQDVVAVRRERQPVLRRQVVVEAHRRELVVSTGAGCWNAERSALTLPVIASNDADRVAPSRRGCPAAACAIDRIGRREASRCAAASASTLTPFGRAAGVAGRCRCCACGSSERRRVDVSVDGWYELLVVHEEERLAAAVVEAGNDDGTADAAAGLIQRQRALRQAAHLVRVGVRVELVALVEVVEARAGTGCCPSAS